MTMADRGMLWWCWYVVVLYSSASSWALITDQSLARKWLHEYNEMAQRVYYEYTLRHWTYNTNLTEYNQDMALEGSVMRADFRKEAYKNATLFDWRHFTEADLRRQFRFVVNIGNSVLEGEDLKQVSLINTDMEMIYSTAVVCKPDNKSHCVPLDPDLTDIMARSRDWDELAWAWQGWRKASGAKIKEKYHDFVALLNKAARLNNFSDAGDQWRSWYDDPDFEAECLRLWLEVKPIYQHLHAYVKRKLQQVYKDREFPNSGHIPAHLLGNMWAQQWHNIRDIVTPYPNHPSLNITKSLRDQNYTALRMFQVAEDFFTSLGLSPMPQSFWDHSMIEKPKDGRQVICHASAWDFHNGKDFRIKQCTVVDDKWLVTIHHEMGHIEYYLQYKHLPLVYRKGANPGFHEAVGDIMSLSVSTPEHLHSIGLLKQISNDREYDLNYLMSQALERIAFLPFGFLVDQWRWSVFRGETTPENYNQKWWQLRCKHQGISPPVPRESGDFDPGSKFHIPSNTPYIRYFVSFITQFQFHKALCQASGHKGPLHRCDIYNSTEAGKKLKDMLTLGSSQPWPVAMEAITGQRKMDAKPLVEFFQPLTDWLKEQNSGYDVTWDEECPPGTFASGSETLLVTSLNVCLLYVLVGFYLNI